MIKQILITIAILLLWCGSGWGITYYVATDGSATVPYDTPAKAAAQVDDVLDYIATQADTTDIIHVGMGSYSGGAASMNFDHVNQSDTTIAGTGRDYCTINMTSASRNIYTSAAVDNVQISDIKFTSNQAGRQIELQNGGGDGWVYEDCVFEALSGLGQVMSSLDDFTNFTYRRCRWRSNGDLNSKPPVDVGGTSSGKFEFCISEACGFAESYYWKIDTSGTVELTNCVILDSTSYALYGNSASLDVDILNSIFAGGLKSTAAVTVRNVNAAGAMDVSYSNIVPNPYDPADYVVENLDTDSNNIKTGSVGISSFGRGGYIVICVDDSDNFVTAQAVETILASYGFKGTYYIDVAEWNSANNSALATMHDNGTMEIGLHSYSHTNTTYEHGLRVTYAGADTNPTVSYDGEIIRVRTTEGNDDANIGASGSADETISDVVGTYSNFTLAKSSTDGQNTAEIHDSCIVTSLENIAIGSPRAVPCDIDFDRTGIAQGFFKDEIADAKSALETITGGTIYSWGFPYNEADATGKAAVRAGTLTSGRASTFSIQTDIDLFALYSIPSISNLVVSEDEVQTRINARALAFNAAQSGSVVFPLFHSLGGGEPTAEEITWAIDEFSKCPGITVTSAYQMATDIIANSTDNEDGTYSREFTTFTNFTLQPNSSCVNAGTDPFANGDGDQRDYKNHMVWSDTLDSPVGTWKDGVEIGAYGYDPRGDIIFGDSPFGLRLYQKQYNIYKWMN